MLTNYSISGKVHIDTTEVACEYRVRNLDTGYTSGYKTSAVGYYNLNLTNYNETYFNVGDIIAVDYTRHYNNTVYTYTLFHILDDNVEVSYDILLTSVAPSIPEFSLITNNKQITISTNLLSIRKLYFKVYIEHNNKFVPIDLLTTTLDTTVISFNIIGRYKLVTYVVDNNRLLYTRTNIFDITDGIVASGAIGQARYFDWE